MSFAGARILSFESRRANEIGELIRINGGVPFVAPALAEVPLEQNTQAFAFADGLYAGQFDMLILLTGVGTRLLARTLATREPDNLFPDALRKITVVARGPKPSAVLREWNVPVTVYVPEPNTWREVLAAVAPRPEKHLAVQEYGRANEDLLNGLRAQGRTVAAVPVYQWTLPRDTEPLAEALRGLLAGCYDAALFTTGVQIEHFLQFAERSGEHEAAIDALRRMFIGSIGPDCSDALRGAGVEPAFEPSHPKMGILVREGAERFGRQRASTA